MIRSRWFRGMVVAAACGGMMLPSGSVFAAGPQNKKGPAKKVQAPVTEDIALGKNGTLRGRFVNEQGKGIEGARVVIRHNGKEVAETITDAQGRYSVQGLRGGQHELVAGSQARQFRLWSKDAAPPSARSESVIVTGQEVVRAQDDYGYGMGPDILTIATLGLGITGTTIGAISLTRINDVDDKVDQILASP